MKKRLFPRLILLLAAWMLLCLPALADDIRTEGSFTAEIRDGCAVIIGWSGVSNWYHHADLVIPETIDGVPVTGIGEEIFSGQYFRSVTFPETLEQIGAKAFYGATIGGTVEIPASVTSIGTYAFSYAYTLEAIHVDSDNPCYTSSDGVLYNKNMTVLYNYPCGKTDLSYTVPDTVTRLFCTSFAQAEYLQDLYVPSASVDAMTYTFYYCPAVIHCYTDTALYTQLLRSRIYPSLGGLQPLTLCDVSVEADGVYATVKGDYTDGTYWLAAYDLQGRFLSVESLSGLYDHFLRFPAGTTRLRLFSIGDGFSPKAEDRFLWKAKE